jgi:NAD(P)-dependent dehydrogenase (short-subunit alcohol dehydrogenase family)
MFSLKGHKALVTGSSRGIGKAIAFALARAGAHVVLHGSKPSAALNESLKEAQAEGLSVSMAISSIGSEEELVLMKRSLEEQGDGDIDILVLNASTQCYMKVHEFDSSTFEDMFKTNLASSFRLINQYVPYMKEQGWGRIISIGSVNQERPAGRLSVYAATKAAQLNLMKTCAADFAPFGVTVNTITPGVIYTDRNAKTLSDEDFAQQILSKIPAGRFGAAEDCAGAAVFLASDAASYVVGADIAVAGGFQL